MTDIVFPDGSTLQDIYDAINSGSGGVTVCTSTTKPTSPSEGDLIYVTDNATGKELEHYDGALWQTVNDNSGLVENPMTANLDVNGYDFDDINVANFGSASTFGKLFWDDTENEFRLYKNDGTSNEWGDIRLGTIYFGGTTDNPSISEDASNNLVLAVAPGNSIILKTV